MFVEMLFGAHDKFGKSKFIAYNVRLTALLALKKSEVYQNHKPHN